MELSGRISAKNFYLLIISFFGTGLISKKMPGTVGSMFATLVAIFILYSSKDCSKVFLILSIITFLVGSVFCDIFIIRKKYEVNRDPNYAVIDEVCGIFLGLYLLGLFAEISLFSIALNFVLFRIFDIFKPFPIKNLENFMKKRNNTVGVGIMIDDVLAAVFAVLLEIAILKCF